MTYRHGAEAISAISRSMIPTARAEAAPSSCWANLPMDLLHDVMRRLHTCTEYICFRAVCKPWRQTLWPQHHPFLPLLLSPRDASGHRTARCIFSSKSRRVQDGRWVVREHDGTVASVLNGSSCCVNGDPFAGSAAVSTPLPPFSCDDERKWWTDHAIGLVSEDGTIVLSLFGPVNRFNLPSFSAYLLPPGVAEWTSLRILALAIRPYERDLFCIAYHGGKIVLSRGEKALCITATQSAVLAGKVHVWITPAPREHAEDSQCTYVLESQGGLLWAVVRVRCANYRCRDRSELNRLDEGSRMAVGLVVSVYTLQATCDETDDWVKKDGRDFANRILFLGQPTSFAVDASRLDMSGGGTYVVIKKRIYGLCDKAIERSFLFRYSFQDDNLEFVEQLPDAEQWNDQDCFWLTPQPATSHADQHKA